MHRGAWLVALALLAPLALAQAEVEDAGGASFLVYRAPGGRDPDPLASPLAPPPEGADRLPTTVFDGAARADRAPENAPERALAHFREFQRLLLSAQAVPAGIEVRLDAEVLPGALRIVAQASAPANVTLVVFEHGVPVDGRPQPYVARFVTAPENGTRVALDVALDPAWSVDRLGVVAIARDGAGAVLNSATWTAARDAPVVQRERAVLVEHVTASWCGPCVPADEALALLATQRGAAGPLDAGETRYFRAPGWGLYAGLALGAIAAIVVLRRAPR